MSPSMADLDASSHGTPLMVAADGSNQSTTQEWMDLQLAMNPAIRRVKYVPDWHWVALA